MADSLEFEDIDFDQYLRVGDGAESQRKRKKRVRNWTAEDRARHRVFERSRREAFNERLNELASLLPSLQNAKEAQLSKHVIVDESVKHHLLQKSTIDELSHSLSDLKAQHEQLLTELNAWRQNLAMTTSVPESGYASGNFTNSVATELPALPAAVPAYAAQHKRQRSVLPSLGTYSEGLVRLEQNPTGAAPSPAHDDAGLPATGVGVPNIAPSMHQALSPPNAMLQNQGLQQLFESSDHSIAAAAGMQATQLYVPEANGAGVSSFDFAAISPEVRDFWRMQWAINSSQGRNGAGAPSAYPEIDVNNATLFRNDTSMMNF